MPPRTNRDSEFELKSDMLSNRLGTSKHGFEIKIKTKYRAVRAAYRKELNLKIINILND